VEQGKVVLHPREMLFANLLEEYTDYEEIIQIVGTDGSVFTGDGEKLAFISRLTGGPDRFYTGFPFVAVIATADLRYRATEGRN